MALLIADWIALCIAGSVGCWCCGCGSCGPLGHRRRRCRRCPGHCRHSPRRRGRGHQLGQNQYGGLPHHHDFYGGYRQFLRPPAPGGHRGRLAAGGWRLEGWPGKLQSARWVLGWHQSLALNCLGLLRRRRPGCSAAGAPASSSGRWRRR